MKKLAILIVIILFSFSIAACNKAAIDFETYFDSVFEIKCISESRFESIGTAFKLNTGEIVTNAHVVSYKEYGEYIQYEEIIAKIYKSSETICLKVKSIDNEKDIAILEPINSTGLFDNISGLTVGETKKLLIGDSMYTIGNLNNYGLCCNQGILSAKEKQIENNGILNSYMQTNIEISKGSSGGPVLNLKGEVVGIMTFKLRDSNAEYVDGISFFIPIDMISSFINK